MPPAKPKRRLRWRTLYAIISGTLTMVFLIVLGTATCRPSWYAPAAIDRGRLKSDKADFANLLDSIGEALNGDEGIEFELTEAQLNRWFVARGEIWPALQFDVQGISGLVINLLDGNRVRLAGTASNGPVTVILSAIGRCEVNPDEVLIEIESVHSGKMPIPSGQVLAPVRDLVAREGKGVASMTGNTIHLRNRWRWENGDRPYRVERLEIAAGRAHVRLEPAP